MCQVLSNLTCHFELSVQNSGCLDPWSASQLTVSLKIVDEYQPYHSVQ